MVTFHRIDDNRTRVMLQVDYDPQGAVENVADALGVVIEHGEVKQRKVS